MTLDSLPEVASGARCGYSRLLKPEQYRMPRALFALRAGEVATHLTKVSCEWVMNHESRVKEDKIFS